MIFELRINAKNRISVLQKSLTDLKLRVAGSINLEKHERACENAKILSVLNKKLEHRINNYSYEKERLESELDGARTKSSMFDEISKAMKETGTTVQRRIAIWHNRMAECQTNQLKAKREAAREKEKYENLKNSSDATFRRVEELEDLINQVQTERDLEVIEWETQQGLYEKTISGFEEERDRLYLTTTPSELKDTLPDRSLPIGEQLEAALRMLVERTRLMKSAQISYQHLENKYNEKLRDFQKTSNLLSASHLELKKLQHQLAVVELGKKDQQSEENGIDSDKSRIREAKALRFAHETTSSLQRQLDLKNEMVQKYRKMMQDMQANLEEKSNQNNQLILDLNKKIEIMTKREIERVQGRTEPKQQAEAADIEENIELLKEMQELIRSKEVALESLAKEFENFKSEIEAEKIHLQAENEQHKSRYLLALSEKSAAEEMAVKAEQELLEVKEMLNRPGVKDLSDVVSKLQLELQSKQLKNSQMKKSMEKLKSQLAVLAKELEESKISNYAGSSSAETLIQQKLANKISQLDLRLKRFKTFNIRANETNLKLQTENGELSLDIQRVSAELLSKNAEMASNSKNSKVSGNANTLASTISGILSQPSQLHKRHGSISNMKTSWEADKAQQKKMDTLKEKLKEKIAEHRALESSYQLLKDSHSRSEKDRLRLQTKLNKLLSESLPVPNVEQSKKIVELEGKIQVLQTALSKSIRKNSVVPLERVAPPLQKEAAIKTDELKREIDDLTNRHKEVQADCNKLDGENQKLKRTLRKDMEKLKKVDELMVANESLKREVLGLRKTAAKIDGHQAKIVENPKAILDLQDAIAEKEKVIQELLSPEVNETSRLSGENRRLKRELEMAQIRIGKLSNGHIKSDLSDENERLKSQTRLMEVELKKMQVELEDLSFNYKELVKQSLLAQK